MTGGGGFRTGSRRTVAGTLAAKVTTDGVRKLTNEFNGLWGVLKKVRSELSAINGLARGGAGIGGMGGVGQGTSTGAAGSGRGDAGMINVGGLMGSIVQRYTGPAQTPMVGPPPPTPPAGGPGGGPNLPIAPVRGPGGFNYGMAVAAGAQIAQAGFNVIENRFQRNVAQSIPISAQDTLTASMYGTPYYGMESRRFGAVGEYGGSRESVQYAQQIALGYGTTAAGSERFMTTAGRVAQASGGTLDAAGAAAQLGLFAAPQVSRRAEAMGATPYRVAGELQDPNKIGLSYVKLYERARNVSLNEIDFANLRSPGSPLRMQFKQLYGLSDEAIDVVISAGMQNLTFKKTPGSGGRDINFGATKDLEAIGMTNDKLGLQAARFGTTQQRREAEFFKNREGDMTDRLNQERMIQEGLQDLETAFGDVLGPMHEFARVLEIATGALGLLGGLSMLTGGGGGGGGILGMLRGVTGGGPGGVPGVPGVPGGAGGMGALAKGGGIAAGAVLAGVGLHTAATAKTGGGMALGVGEATAGGALIGTMIAPGIGTAIGAGVGFVAGSAFAAINYFGGVDKKNVKKGFDAGVGMTDKELIANLGDYVKNAEEYGGKGQGAGAKQRGRFDAFARRRGALLAAALDEAMTSGALKLESTTEGTEVGSLVEFFGSDGVFNDDKLWSNKGKAKKYIDRLQGSAVWKKYFSITDPFAYQENNTAQNKSLIMTPEQAYAAASGQAGATPTGDPMFDGSRPIDPFPLGGDPVSDRAEGTGETWNKLNSQLKERLLRLFRASGGRVWLGGGWRSSTAQEQMFRSRYVIDDANGSIEWQGHKWRHVSGFAAAPPGRSYHEIGLAADLAGDLNWVVAHAHEFGLRHFADVNNEPHHVQPVEIPGGRSKYDGSFPGGGGDVASGTGSEGGTGTSGGTAVSGALSGGGGSSASISGIGYSMGSGVGGYSIANAATGTVAPGGGFGGSVGALAGGATGGGAGWTGEWPTDLMEKGAATAKAAAGAGFTGQDLINFVAISFRESGWNPTSWVEDDDDVGGGLWAINQLPWLKKHLTPPWTKAEIQDPNRAAQIAKEMFDSRGYQPWTTAGGAMARTDQARALQAVQLAGLGDPMSDSRMSMYSAAAPGGTANVNINVSINSTGNPGYDAKALGEAVRPVLTNVMAEIHTKRGS